MNNLNELDNSIPQPEMLGIELMEHQKKSIYEMIKLEKNGVVNIKNVMFYDNDNNDLIVNTRIGILGDMVGTGKSLMIVSLCLMNKYVENREIYYSSDKYVNIIQSTEKYEKKPNNLVIVPDNLVKQWEDFFKLANGLETITFKKNENTENCDIIIIPITKLCIFLKQYENIIWNRVIIDEADRIKLNNNLIANFIWLVTGTPSGIALSKSKYIKNFFGNNINWLTDGLTIKNNNEYAISSMKLPVLNRIIITCKTPPEVNILQDIIPKSIIQMINAGNSDEAIKTLNCQVDTKDNIFKTIKKAIENNIYNKQLEIESEKKKKYGNVQYDNSLKKINQLNKSIEKLESRLKSIQTKIKDSDEDICPICMGEIEKDPVILNCCGSMFCLECFTCTSANKTTCPYCIRKISSKSMHIIGKKSKKIQKHNLMFKNDALIDIIEKSKGGVLFFANFENTFSKIKELMKNNNIKYDILKEKSVDKIIDNFNKGKIKVLMMNALNFGAGLNLQKANNVIIYHRFTSEMEEQVIGRAQRIGRTTNLNVYYLIHNNETESYKGNFQINECNEFIDYL